MKTLFSITHYINQYLSGLDWTYIFTFILITYGLRTFTPWFKKTRLSLGRRYRVTLIGILYAALLAWIRGNSLAQVELLLSSFVFALVFHKLIIDHLIKTLTQVFFNHPKSKPHEN